LGIADSVLVDPDYGDRVSASPDTNGHSYGLVGSELTPSVVVNYGGGPNPVPALWTTGYGDLTNVLYNETDGDDALTIHFVADSGNRVGLFNFDMATFGGGDQDIPGMEIRDESDTVLWSVDSTTISGSTRTMFDIAGGIFGRELTLDIDLTGLGGASDNIGIDNIQFTAQAIPEPSTAVSAMFGPAAIGVRRKRRRQEMPAEA